MFFSFPYSNVTTVSLYDDVHMKLREHHEAFPVLSELSLGGITSMSDEDVSTLLSPPSFSSGPCSSCDPDIVAIGERLQSFNIRECPLLTDHSLASIRLHCHSLSSLDVSYVPLLTTPALHDLFTQVQLGCTTAGCIDYVERIFLIFFFVY